MAALLVRPLLLQRPSVRPIGSRGSDRVAEHNLELAPNVASRIPLLLSCFFPPHCVEKDARRRTREEERRAQSSAGALQLPRSFTLLSKLRRAPLLSFRLAAPFFAPPLHPRNAPGLRDDAVRHAHVTCFPLVRPPCSSGHSWGTDGSACA